MRPKYFTLKILKPTEDGLGGYKKDFQDVKVFGKAAYAKNKMDITRANHFHIQKLVNIVKLYLDVNRNDMTVLKTIKKGDKLIYNNESYSVNLIEAYEKLFSITLLEDFDTTEESNFG